MRTQGKEDGFATKISIQSVEVILTRADLFRLLSGESVAGKHYDKTSPATFFITLKKENDEQLAK